MKFRKSSYCGLGSCVEVGVDGDDVVMRDSKNPELEVRCTRQEWEDFLAGVRNGEFDV